MAIILTEMGVAGCLEAMSAAFAFASVTTSARAPGAPASSRTTRSGRPALRERSLFMLDLLVVGADGRARCLRRDNAREPLVHDHAHCRGPGAYSLLLTS